MPRPPQRAALDPQRALLHALERERRTLADELGPLAADALLDRLVHLRLLADLDVAPDQLGPLATCAAPWPALRAASRALRLPPLPRSPASPGLAALCRRLADEPRPLPIDLLARLHERSLAGADDPGRRKRSGVFYTPHAIVRLLIDQALGPALAGRAPAELAAVRVCDPSCGAGSFLLAAYERLLAAHADWYRDHPDDARRDGCRLAPDGAAELSLTQRRAILTTSIFGADLDPRALDLAGRALDLRMRAGHPGPLTPRPTQNLARLDALEPGALERRFAAVLRAGGFDLIVGNPPYVRPSNLDPAAKQRHRAHYTAFRAKADLYACFLQRPAGLLRPGARLGYVVARGWLALDSFDELRRHLLAHYCLEQLIDLPARAFPDAQVETHALVFRREPDPLARAASDLAVRVLVDDRPHTLRTIPQRAFADTYRNVLDLSIEPTTAAIKAIMRRGPALGSLYDVAFGLKTGDDREFLHRREARHRDDRPLLRGEDVQRYGHVWAGEYVRYDPARMRAHRATARPGEAARFERPKLLVKDTSKDLGATFEDGAHYVKDVLIVLPRASQAPDLKALLGVLNSHAMRFYYRSTFPTLHVQSRELASLPLPIFDLASASGRAAHDRLVTLVERRLALALEHRDARSDAARARAAARIRDLERRIDALVHAQYGLDAAAVRALEAATAASPASRPAAR